jgi:Tfp pilus assembly protein PilN
MYENYVVPLQRRASKSRQATKGVFLHKTIQSMGTRMPISVVKGNKRPQDPLQAAKFASEGGVVVRSQLPIFPH